MIKQVTNVSNVALTVLTPSQYTKMFVIQNNGVGVVRLTFDGGSTYTDGQNINGTDPTLNTGYLLNTNQQIIVTSPLGQSVKDAIGFHRPVRGILANVNSTTTLDILTDDNSAS